MPIRKTNAGYKIKRGNSTGWYPKVYSSKKKAEARVRQMETHRRIK
ncbi:hypothetical protein [Candidatus Oleimmundimicrobium sp.]|nr:hypothetical protein [Candidatus Oleimmundimicrobium sp.]MDO8885732.1 hypothetical protein [Candidatus Oleimmundimicrobium sp.]